MGSVIKRPSVLVAILLISLWPVWRWYIARLADSSDEPWGILAIVTVAILIYKSNSKPNTDTNYLLHAALCILFYAATFNFLPPLVRAIIGCTALTFVISGWRLGTRFHIGLWALLLCALPTIPTLQFYIGYPLRVLIAEGSAPLLGLLGMHVVREGTGLVWGATTIAVDAPCSGVKMLWVACFITAAVGSWYRFNLRGFVAGGMLALAATVVGNISRTTSLFFLETETIAGPGWMHDGVGLVIFAFISVTIILGADVLERRKTCVMPSYS